MTNTSCLVILSFCVFIAIDAASAPRRVCYFTNWSCDLLVKEAHFCLQHIDASLCSHIIYAFVGINVTSLSLSPSRVDDESHGDVQGTFVRFNKLKTIERNLKTLLSVGGSYQTEMFVQVTSSPTKRKEFAANTAHYVRHWGFDGLDIDWEFPQESHKADLTSLLKDLRTAFREEVTISGKKELLLSIAAPASDERINSGFQVKEISQYVDMINLMAYDFYGAWGEITGFNSPLYPRTSDTRFSFKHCVEWTVNLWLMLGAPASKLNLGIAGYGQSFTLDTATRNTSDTATQNTSITATRNTSDHPTLDITDRLSTSSIRNAKFDPKPDPNQIFDAQQSTRVSSPVNGKQTPNPPVNGKQTPNPQVNGKQTPNPQVNGKQTPNPQVNGKQTPNPPVNGKQTPNPAVNGKQTPVNEKQLAILNCSSQSLLCSPLESDLENYVEEFRANSGGDYYPELTELVKRSQLKSIDDLHDPLTLDTPTTTMKSATGELADILSREQSAESVATLSREQTAESVATLPREQSAESVATLSREQTAESVATLSREQSGESVATLSREQSGESVATLSREQSGESVATLSREQSGESVATLSREQSGESVATLSREQSAESVATLPREQSGESVATLYGVGSRSVGKGQPGRLRHLDGQLSYPEICESSIKHQSQMSWDEEQQVPFVTFNNQWVSFDNVQSVITKVKWALSKDLGGIMFWSLDLDDFTGDYCGEGRFPLLSAITATLLTSSPSSQELNSDSESPTFNEVFPANQTVGLNDSKQDMVLNPIPPNSTSLGGQGEGTEIMSPQAASDSSHNVLRKDQLSTTTTLYKRREHMVNRTSSMTKSPQLVDRTASRNVQSTNINLFDYEEEKVNDYYYYIAFRAEPAANSAKSPGWRVAGSPVAGSPVAGSPVAGSPVAGSPVAGSPVAGSPVSGSPVVKNMPTSPIQDSPAPPDQTRQAKQRPTAHNTALQAGSSLLHHLMSLLYFRLSMLIMGYVP
ncbi:uncharacterized protein LOC131957453 [Physella acuta]|uniref:uncharacterized protein LOC131957453 n=1 Tax=Physella acuta TaxID=109671 RepID=UPI0027DCA3D2|nr:uncharacterized protein LOC131957453 [Physella acuta]